MKTSPILFSAPLVRAILDGSKTQTRRVAKPQPPQNRDFLGSDFGVCRSVADGIKMFSQNDYPRLPKHPTDWDLVGSVGVARDAGFPMTYRSPWGGAGDRIWVRETWYCDDFTSERRVTSEPTKAQAAEWRESLYFRADGEPDFEGGDGPVPWKPSIHMPRWASRLTLEIVDVRLEQLQSITDADALAEGISRDTVIDLAAAIGREPGAARRGFQALWDGIYGGTSSVWEKNCWVWAVSFKVVPQEVTS